MTNCPPAVTESTPRRRTSIQVFWTAPPSGSGCVVLKYVLHTNVQLTDTLPHNGSCLTYVLGKVGP